MLLVNLSGRGDKDMAQAQAAGSAMSRYAAMFAARREACSAPSSCSATPISASSAAILDELVAGGADMIEVGIPFSDPIADGPVIQAAAVRALGARACGRPIASRCSAAFARAIRDVPVGILTYANLVLARGRDAFYRAAREAGRRTACSSPTCR